MFKQIALDLELEVNGIEIPDTIPEEDRISLREKLDGIIPLLSEPDIFSVAIAQKELDEVRYFLYGSEEERKREMEKKNG